MISEIAFTGDVEKEISKKAEASSEERERGEGEGSAAGDPAAAAGGGKGESSEPLEDSFDIESIKVKGSYGSKIEAVVKRVLSILERDGTAKLLVFSEWQDVLELVAHAFQGNRVDFVYAKGKAAMSKAVKRFKSEASVMMLPVKLGANGLNLIEAQHVILIEPLLDPAKEAQAFGRVDRIGQTKKTFVHRFIMAQTVEEKVYLLAQQRARMYSVMGEQVRAKGKNGTSDLHSLTVRDVKDLLRGDV
eukprot:CAMPEP_0197490264 /NCGR_PEP_ID=MMETSP1311-20131121/4841_1 /TAXON_ID=464262 /ORGANISM="Genus nov. species nov., Strain RCC856" /LENGTH=246 /DNA_ID=CAMNT_0043034749 /DNA_START=60 /DNA_END=800 /DNA_ORIENTATION=+